MAIIKLSDNFKDLIAIKFDKNRLKHTQELKLFLDNDKDIQSLYFNISSLLQSDSYVVVKNLQLHKDKNLFYVFSSLFGEMYPEIDFTDIKVNCPHSGCKLKYLPWHTDDAILGTNQPKITTIYLLQEDPLKLPQNGILNIDDLVYYLELNDIDFLEELLNRKIHFASHGVHYSDDKKEKIIVEQTLLYKENKEIKVRFDLHRIKFYYEISNTIQSLEEKKFISRFLSFVEKLKQTIYLEKNDFLILNNQKTLHDRGECSLELDENGITNTREIFVGFVVK